MNSTKKNILIVDDNQLIRNIIKGIIEKKYFPVGEALNGNEAIKKYHELKPDLVLMDIMMPEKNGIDAMKDILKQDPQAKIIIVSTLDQKIHVTKEMREGALDWITKPIEDDQLLDSIAKYI